MKIEIDGKSLLGKREEQQDYFVYRQGQPLTLAVVCDGMGGIEGGAMASRLAAITFKDDLKTVSDTSNIPKLLVSEAKKIDDLVFQQTDNRGKWIDCGTTIVAVVIENNHLHWLSVGDSRIFICRGNEMLPLNREHNYRLQLDQLLKENKITIDDYQSEERKANQLISYIGVGNVNIMDINEKPFELVQGDRILLCSDGLTKTVDEESIRSVMGNNLKPSVIVEQLSMLIEEKNRKGQDNATFVCISCMEE